MRPVALLSLLLGVAACAGDGTAPRPTVINVRVRDDRGVPVERTEVVVGLTSTRVKTITRGDGTVDVGVAGAGVYQVLVLPRAGYVFTDAMSRSVRVDENATVVVDVTMPRQGLLPEDPRYEPKVH